MSEIAGVPSCMACSAKGSEKFMVENGYDIFRCPACGLIFVHPIPEMETLRGLYDEVHETLTPEMWKHHSKDVFSAVAGKLKQIKPSGKSLDVGAGSGDFVEVMASLGYDAMGIEIASEPVKEAKERGVNLMQGTLAQAGFQDNSFDIVTLWWVLEHVADPFAILEEAARILKTGGILALRVPNISFILGFQRLKPLAHLIPSFGKDGGMINPVSHKKSFFEVLAAPYHLWGFTQESLKIMLASLGFDAVRISLDGRNVTDGFMREILERMLYISGKSSSKLFGAKNMLYHDMNLWAVKGASR